MGNANLPDILGLTSPFVSKFLMDDLYVSCYIAVVSYEEPTYKLKIVFIG